MTNNYVSTIHDCLLGAVCTDTITSTVSFFGLSKDWKAHRADLIIELGLSDPQICDRYAGTEFGPLDLLSESPNIKIEVKCRNIEREWLKHIGDYNFGKTAYVARAIAILL